MKCLTGWVIGKTSRTKNSSINSYSMMSVKYRSCVSTAVETVCDLRNDISFIIYLFLEMSLTFMSVDKHRVNQNLSLSSETYLSYIRYSFERSAD